MNSFVRVRVANVTFNNISVISWQSVLLMKETGVPRENHQAAASHCETLSHNTISNAPLVFHMYTVLLFEINERVFK